MTPTLASCTTEHNEVIALFTDGTRARFVPVLDANKQIDGTRAYQLQRGGRLVFELTLQSQPRRITNHDHGMKTMRSMREQYNPSIDYQITFLEPSVSQQEAATYWQVVYDHLKDEMQADGRTMTLARQLVCAVGTYQRQQLAAGNAHVNATAHVGTSEHWRSLFEQQ